MGRFTPLSLTEAQRLSASFEVEVAGVEPLEAGSVNSNFRLITPAGKALFGRIYEEQGQEGARAELGLLERLASAGVPTVAPCPRRAAEVPEHHGKPFAVYPWVEGQILCQARVRPVHCERVGEALATMHLATPRLGPLPAGRFNVGDLRQRLARIERESAEHAPAARSIRKALDDLAGRRDTALPSGLIHGDLFRDNVLWNGDAIAALLDFESASEGPFVYDLMVCVLAWCYTSRFEVELARALVRGYERVRPLQARERRAAVVEGGLGCLRFATTRITDFSMRAPAGQPPKRDYRRFLERLEALEAGALESVLG